MQKVSAILIGTMMLKKIEYCKCERCGKPMPLQRKDLIGKAICKSCSEQITTPVREVSLAATSLHWI